MTTETRRRTNDDMRHDTGAGDDADTVEDDLLELGRVARRVLQKNVHRARGRVSDAVSAARDKADEVKDGVTHRVQEHPLKALLIASGVGALVALLLRGNRK